MALTKASMKDKIKAAISAVPGINDVDFNATFGGSVTMEDVLEAFCGGIIDEIQTNAEVKNTPDDGVGHTHTPATID